jgi:hypothetical protein
MTVTLAQAKLLTTDDIDVNIINEFQKSSFLLDRLTFDDVVSGAGNGATLTYGYTRQITQRGAAFRAINAEYTPTEITKARYTVDLKPLGGSFQIDRVLNRMAAGAETAFQMGALIQGTASRFANAVINGDTAGGGDAANGFDGLNKILTGTATEYLPLSNGVTLGYRDWTAVTTKATALAEIAALDDWLSLLSGPPDCIIGPRKALVRFKQIAAWADYYDRTVDAFGRPVNNYNGIPLIDLLTIEGANTDVIPLVSRDTDAGGAGGTITNLADLYAVRFGLDGLHGVSMSGAPLIQKFLPDFTTPGAVKTGEVEMGPLAVVLKATKAAAVFRNIKVA